MNAQSMPAQHSPTHPHFYSEGTVVLFNGVQLSLPSQPGQAAILLYCKPCHEVYQMTPYDTVPLYQVRGDQLEESPAQERDTFLRKHWGHPLTTLKRKKDRLYSDRPVWDPFRIAYEEVTDGQETFLLKSWRAAIAESRHYALLRGSLDITTTVFLPEELLHGSLIDCFPSFTPLIPGIVKALQKRVARFSGKELIPAYCSADDPLLSFAYLAEHHLRMLVRCCCEAGLSSERDRLWDFFIKRQQEEELTVELRQHCRPCFS